MPNSPGDSLPELTDTASPVAAGAQLDSETEASFLKTLSLIRDSRWHPDGQRSFPRLPSSYMPLDYLVDALCEGLGNAAPPRRDAALRFVFMRAAEAAILRAVHPRDLPVQHERDSPFACRPRSLGEQRLWAVAFTEEFLDDNMLNTIQLGPAAGVTDAEPKGTGASSLVLDRDDAGKLSVDADHLWFIEGPSKKPRFLWVKKNGKPGNKETEYFLSLLPACGPPVTPSKQARDRVRQAIDNLDLDGLTISIVEDKRGVPTLDCVLLCPEWLLNRD